MTRLLERSRFVVAIASLSLGALSLVSMGWGVLRTIDFVGLLLRDEAWKDGKSLAPLLQTLDIFLVATVLLVVAFGLWELFIGDLDLPDWLEMRDLGALKSAAADLIILVVAIKYVERFASGGPSLDLLYEAGAVALLSGTLIAFTAFKKDRSH